MKKFNEYHPEKLLKLINKNWLSFIKSNSDYCPKNESPIGEEVFCELQAWYNSGRNIFTVNSHLFNLLSKSDIDTISLNTLKLPYQSLYIDFNSTFEGIEGAYISTGANSNEPVDGISILFARSNCDIVEMEDRFTLHIPGDYIEDGSGNLIENIIEIFDYTLTEKVESSFDYYALKVPLTEVINILLYLSLPKKDIIEQYPSDVPTHLQNALKDADTKRRKEKAEQAIREAGFTKVKYVGQSFNTISTGTGAGKAIHWRRGHWRNQAHGEGMKLTKLLWIMPTIINADKGEPIKGHIYEL